MFGFYEMWASLVFVAILGSRALATIEQGPMDHFKIFHECITNISLKSSNFGCSQSEECLQTMFNASEQFLNTNMETVKLEIQHSLDSLKYDCSNMFTEAQKNHILCQTEQISLCLSDSETIRGNMCRQMKNLSDCLRHLGAKCFNRVFVSILRSISIGIWDNHRCTSAVDAIGRNATGRENVLGVNQSLQIQDLDNLLASNPLSRSLDHAFFDDTNSSSPNPRQGSGATPMEDFTLDNVTAEGPTTKLLNSAKIRAYNYLLLLLSSLTCLIV